MQFKFSLFDNPMKTKHTCPVLKPWVPKALFRPCPCAAPLCQVQTCRDLGLAPKIERSKIRAGAAMSIYIDSLRPHGIKLDTSFCCCLAAFLFTFFPVLIEVILIRALLPMGIGCLVVCAAGEQLTVLCS